MLVKDSNSIPGALRLNLPSLNLTTKSLFTGYLVTVGLGVLLASAQILMTHDLANGKLGLSTDDIVYSYHGDPAKSKIETKLKGSMRDKASSADKLKIIIKNRPFKRSPRNNMIRTRIPILQRMKLSLSFVKMR